MPVLSLHAVSPDVPSAEQGGFVSLALKFTRLLVFALIVLVLLIFPNRTCRIGRRNLEEACVGCVVRPGNNNAENVVVGDETKSQF